MQHGADSLVTQLLSLSSKFTYDWNQSQTAISNLPLIPKIEQFLETIPTGYTFEKTEHKKIYCRLLYKLSTYYLHYRRDYNNALKRLTTIEDLNKNESLLDAEEMTALFHDLAYAYQIKGDKNDRPKVLDYCNQVISKETAIKTESYEKKVAYARIVIGHIHRDNDNDEAAEKCYRTALIFYESIDTLDEQYIRLKNTLAQVVSKQDKIEEAGKIFSEVSEYWGSKDYNQNHYAANHFFAYADYCFKNKKYPQAAMLINQVIHIYNNTHTDSHKDYFIYSKLPELAQAIYGKLPEQEKIYTSLNIYINNLKHPSRTWLGFWNEYRGPIVVGSLAVTAAIGVGIAMKMTKGK